VLKEMMEPLELLGLLAPEVLPKMAVWEEDCYRPTP
jgi:hypothetical protein